MSRSRALLALAATTLLLAACSAPVELRVDVPVDETDRWASIVGERPLPEGFVLELSSPAHAGEADEAARVPALRLRRTVGIATPTRRDRVVLERRWLVPSGPIWDPQAGELVPLDRIELPQTALPYGRRYVDDPLYAGVQELVLELDPAAPGLGEADERLAELRSWMESIPGAPRERPAVVWIGGAGDIMVARGVTELLDRSDGLDLVFSDVRPLLEGVDFLIGNLEGAVTTRGTALSKGFTFRFHPRVLDPLARVGFDYLSVVNNHTYDYGEIGFLDTMAHLSSSPIATAGVGRTLAEAARPFVTELAFDEPEPVEASGGCAPCGHARADGATGETGTGGDGLPVVVLSVGAYPVERSGFDGARTTAATADRPGVLWAEPRNREAMDAALEAMRDSFGEETFDVVVVHGGDEWATAPASWQRGLYRSYVDAGADLVLGHHSHVVQGLESYRGALIAYSLGNFVFPGMYLTEFGEQSVLLRVGVVIDGESVRIGYVEPIPVRIDHQVLRLDPDGPLPPRMRAATRRLHGL